jgi:hypothetical protein
MQIPSEKNGSPVGETSHQPLASWRIVQRPFDLTGLSHLATGTVRPHNNTTHANASRRSTMESGGVIVVAGNLMSEINQVNLKSSVLCRFSQKERVKQTLFAAKKGVLANLLITQSRVVTFPAFAQIYRIQLTCGEME